MDFSNLIWLLPAGSIAYVAARMMAGNRRFKRELEAESFANFQDMAASWRQSRMQDTAKSVMEGHDGIALRTNLEIELYKVRSTLPEATKRDNAAQREVRLATNAMFSVLKAHPELFQKMSK